MKTLNRNIALILKVASYNITILMAMVFVFELIFGAWIFDWPFNLYVIDYASCKNPVTYWSYCPETTAINRMKAEDGGAWIENHVNKSSVRVGSFEEMLGETDFDSYSVYITGDSFIQADEVEFDQTLGHWVEQTTKRKTLHHGYSSWAAVQYMNYLTTINFKKGDAVFVFLNLTDFSPEDHNSNYNWYNYDHTIENGQMRFQLSESDRRQNRINAQIGGWLNRSISLRLFEFVQKKWESMVQTPRDASQFSRHKSWEGYEVFDDEVREVSTNCSLLDQKYDRISPATLDFLVYSFDVSCWPERFHSSYQSAVRDLNKLADYVSERDADLYVVLFPMGWSYTNENTIGKQHPYYSMGANAVITTKGVLSALKIDIHADVLSVESLLAEHNSDEPNDLYFANDGHWTAKTQKILGEWLGQFLLQNKVP